MNWTIELAEKTGLPGIKHRTVPVVTPSYIGWEKAWAWANTAATVGDARLIDTGITGTIALLDLQFSGTRTKTAENAMRWDFALTAAAAHPEAIGYGIQFDVVPDSASFDGAIAYPVLASDMTGWTWTINGETVEIRFDAPIASLIFENATTKKTIRAFFYKDIPVGSRSVGMTVTLPAGGQIETPLPALYAPMDTASWIKDSISPTAAPVDLSWLNDAPAGKHGAVVADGDRLAFADGTPVRFWGTNVQAYAIFKATDVVIVQHAERIAKLGFNLVRLHHHDSLWSKPNIFENPAIDTLSLSAESLRKVDLWVATLKEFGVYVWLDLHVERNFTANDGIDNFAEIAKGKASVQVKGFNYYNTSIQARMRAFNEQYLGHVNQYTGIAYKSDPAIMGLLITNENDLTQHFGNALLADKNVPAHNALFEADSLAFATATGLDKNKVKRTWEHGESKIYLNDAEHRFNQMMIDHLRSLGASAMVATTNTWGKMGISGLPSLTDGDIIDAHSYGRAEEMNFNPKYRAGFLSWLAAAQVVGKPMSVTEWNIEPYPARDRFTAPLYLASIASLQGWDAIMLYGYSQVGMIPWDNNNGSNYSTYNDAAMMAIMPAAALLYRLGHVAEAKNHYRLQTSRDTLFFAGYSPEKSKSLRTLIEQSKVSIGLPAIPELPWLAATPETGTAVADMGLDFIPEETHVCSDTGELFRCWEAGIQTIDAPCSKVAAGWIGGTIISLTGVEMDCDTPKAVIALQSLDGEEVIRSKAILLSVVAQVLPSAGTSGPFYAEPVRAKVSIEFIEGASSDVAIAPIQPDGSSGASTLVPRVAGKHRIDLEGLQKTHWYRIERTAKKCSKAHIVKK